jgi:hypothetical protein
MVEGHYKLLNFFLYPFCLTILSHEYKKSANKGAQIVPIAKPTHYWKTGNFRNKNMYNALLYSGNTNDVYVTVNSSNQ